jgi:hypothetical protein
MALIRWRWGDPLEIGPTDKVSPTRRVDGEDEPTTATGYLTWK